MYLARPASAVEVASASDYFRTTRTAAAGPAVAERGRDAGAALGADPAAAVAEITGRVLPLVDGCDGSELVTTIAGGMRLADYLPTRTFELAVHGLDIARAAELSFELPANVLEAATVLAAKIGVATGRGDTLLMSLTGRETLPSSFSVV
jgi:hypothetical protein